MPTGQGQAPAELLGPLNLHEARNAPDRLYVSGHVEWLREHPRVAVVGSRQVSEEGTRRTARLVRGLVGHGAIVVSGLAKGVDSVAHRTAIDRGGRTIAVIGTPLSQTYPAANRELQHQIAREHLLVSQFPEGMRTQRAFFPMRNRTMALISDASVIVEAGETSGSLSQGWEALRLGRPLFLLRSVVDSPGLRWPEQMLDYGARVLDDVEDLVSLLPFGSVDDIFAAIA